MLDEWEHTVLEHKKHNLAKSTSKIGGTWEWLTKTWEWLTKTWEWLTKTWEWLTNMGVCGLGNRPYSDPYGL
jgi:hypothetical protein